LIQKKKLRSLLEGVIRSNLVGSWIAESHESCRKKIGSAPIFCLIVEVTFQKGRITREHSREKPCAVVDYSGPFPHKIF